MSRLVARPHTTLTPNRGCLMPRCILFCAAAIILCVVNYTNDQADKEIPGWPAHRNRDIEVYILPNKNTTIHTPRDICPKRDKLKKNHQFLLVVVMSAIENFDRRVAIRKTWGNYKEYKEISKIFKDVKGKYNNHNFTYDLQTYTTVGRSKIVSNVVGKRRNMSASKIWQKAAKTLNTNLAIEEKNSDVTKFSSNKYIEQNLNNDYKFYNNIQKRMSRKFRKTPNIENNSLFLKVTNYNQNSSNTNDFKDKTESIDTQFNADELPDFKLTFLLGFPEIGKNHVELQTKVDEEVEKYGDVIQESFVDAYTNLTLKSIMMLKWITQNCNESVRYILKTDDDTFINLPIVVDILKNKSKEFDNSEENGDAETEHLLMGKLYCGVAPVRDATDKWYVPRYMFEGRVYPCYLSGPGYVFASATAFSLYRAALRTPHLHLEDVYITGVCASHASPPLSPTRFPPRGAGGAAGAGGVAGPGGECAALAPVTHRVTSHNMAALLASLYDAEFVQECVRRMNQVGHPVLYILCILLSVTSIGLILFYICRRRLSPLFRRNFIPSFDVVLYRSVP